MELTEVPTSIPDKGVSIKVAATGVYHSDLHVLEGKMTLRRRVTYWGTRCLAGLWSSAPVVKTPTTSPQEIPSSCLG